MKSYYGIVLKYELNNYLFNLTNEELWEYETKQINQQHDKGNILKFRVFEKGLLNREEQTEHIKHLIFSYAGKSSCDIFFIHFSVEERKIQAQTGFHVMKQQIITKPAGINMLFSYSKYDTKEVIFECFLHVLKISKRYAALHNVEAKEKHEAQTKQIKDEIEFMPPNGIKFQQARDEFNESAQFLH